MAKLTRYNSFEELKADIQPNTRTEAERNRTYAELEEFIKLLQQDLAAKKKAKRSNGQ
jgi:tRNA1(Val) A37 N6-methylase TrmN6